MVTGDTLGVFFPPFCDLDLLELRCHSELGLTRWDEPTAQLYLYTPNWPSPGRQLHRWSGHFVCWAWLVYFSESVRKVLKGCLCYQKDILDLCPNGFDEILQVLVLKNRTKSSKWSKNRMWIE